MVHPRESVGSEQPAPPRGVVVRDFALRGRDIPAPMQVLGKLYTKLGGWTVEGGIPAIPKMVLVAYPHTSNWDFPNMLGVGWHLGLWPSWFGKASLFKGPVGVLNRLLRGIPVERSSAHNIVDQLAVAFRESEQMVLLVPVEGTRGWRDHWKSGFYFIARGAGVPIGLTYLDYSRRRTGIGGVIWPSDDVKADMDAIRAFYAEIDPKGRFPELASPIRLRAEDGAGADPDAILPSMPVGAVESAGHELSAPQGS